MEDEKPKAKLTGSPFFNFLGDFRARHPGSTKNIKEMAIEAGAQWKSLSPAVRQKYIDDAKIIRARRGGRRRKSRRSKSKRRHRRRHRS